MARVYLTPLRKRECGIQMSALEKQREGFPLASKRVKKKKKEGASYRIPQDFSFVSHDPFLGHWNAFPSSLSSRVPLSVGAVFSPVENEERGI